jgi:hypothetical protein
MAAVLHIFYLIKAPTSTELPPFYTAMPIKKTDYPTLLTIFMENSPTYLLMVAG